MLCYVEVRDARIITINHIMDKMNRLYLTVIFSLRPINIHVCSCVLDRLIAERMLNLLCCYTLSFSYFSYLNEINIIKYNEAKGL